MNKFIYDTFNSYEPFAPWERNADYKSLIWWRDFHLDVVNRYSPYPVLSITSKNHNDIQMYNELIDMLSKIDNEILRRKSVVFFGYVVIFFATAILTYFFTSIN